MAIVSPIGGSVVNPVSMLNNLAPALKTAKKRASKRCRECGFPINGGPNENSHLRMPMAGHAVGVVVCSVEVTDRLAG